MIVDCRNYKDAMEAQRHHWHPFVDGREIFAVWYVDTDEGLVKTYAIHQFEGRLDHEYAPYFDWGLYSDWELEVEDRLVSRTIRGVVELRSIQ